MDECHETEMLHDVEHVAYTAEESAKEADRKACVALDEVSSLLARMGELEYIVAKIRGVVEEGDDG